MADGTSLLDQAGADPIGALMSLLSPVVTGGAVTPSPGSILTDQQQSTAMPAWLAFATKMAQAGAPTLGPPVSLGNALVGAMGQGYQAARESQMLPYLGAAAQREAQSQELGLQKQQFDFDRARQVASIEQGVLATLPGVSGTQGNLPGAGPGATTAPSGSPPGSVQAATSQQIAALPDFQNLPDQTRVPAIMAATSAGMGTDEAAQWARMLKQESGGLQVDSSGKVITSPKGALGVGQVMPGTFTDMQAKYGFGGSPTDLLPNLAASSRYFHEGVVTDGLHNAVVRYSAGPDALKTYQTTGQLPAETADYLAKTNAPPASGTTTGGGGPADLAMVRDPVTGNTVPASIVSQARAALASSIAGPPGTGLQAYQKVISDYVQNQSQQAGVTPLTDAELAALPNRLPGVDYMATRYPDGRIKEIVTPGMRMAGMPFTQAKEMEDQITGSDVWKLWQNGGSRYDAVIASLNQRTAAGDRAALESLAKVFDPGSVVNEGKLQASGSFGGLPQELMAAYASLAGGVRLPDDVRQQIANLATAEQQTRDQAAMEAIERTRASAAARMKGFDANTIMPLFRPKALTADDPRAEGAPPGVQFPAPLTWNADTQRFERKAPATAAAPGITAPPAATVPPGTPTAPPAATVPPGAPTAPPAATTPPGTPTAPPAARPATGAPAAKDTLNPRTMPTNRAGLANIGRDMLANPGRYSTHDRELFLQAEKQLQ